MAGGSGSRMRTLSVSARQAETDKGSRWGDVIGPDAADWPARRAELIRLANRFLWSPADAEDVVHDAILDARSATDQLRDPSRAAAWLRRIVVRKALLHLRQRRLRERSTVEAARRARELPPGPGQSAEQQEQVMKLRQAIGQLPRQQQMAVSLRHLEGLCYPESAEVMGVAEVTVRFHVRQARQRLARMMEGEA